MTIPKYVLANTKTGTSRKFKSQKRKQLRKLKHALDDLRSGCAFFPNGSTDVENIAQAISRIEEDISVANWGN